MAPQSTKGRLTADGLRHCAIDVSGCHIESYLHLSIPEIVFWVRGFCAWRPLADFLPSINRAKLRALVENRGAERDGQRA